MKILIIQSNGKHEKNKHFRECFCLARSFQKLNYQTTIWGLGHESFNQSVDFENYSLIINLENYDTSKWIPDMSKIKTKKMLWSIDAHCAGEAKFNYEFNRGNYSLLLHSTKDYADGKKKVWFPNCYDSTLIGPRKVDKRSDIGFCGNVVNRQEIIDFLKNNFNFIFDKFVIGEDMVRTINSYKIHFNKNMLNDINYRNFETIGCGIPLITNYNYQYKILGFKQKENALFYNNKNELKEILTIVLKDKKMLENISKNSLLLARKHTYDVRAKFLIEVLYKNL